MSAAKQDTFIFIKGKEPITIVELKQRRILAELYIFFKLFLNANKWSSN